MELLRAMAGHPGVSRSEGAGLPQSHDQVPAILGTIHCRGSASVMRLSRADVIVADGPAVLHWQRDKDPAGQRCLVALNVNGTLSIEGRARCWEARDDGSGACVLLPSDDPLTIKITADTKTLFVMFDSAWIHPLVIDQGAENLQVEGSAAFAGAYAFFRAMVAEKQRLGERFDEAEAEDFCREITRIVISRFLRADRDARSLERRIRAAIDRRYPDPAVGCKEIAQEVGVSLRTLQRAFSGSGQSISEALRSARTQHAARLLERYPTMTRRALAATSGFNSITSLNRALTHAKRSAPMPRNPEWHPGDG